jgi:hypothetical protein
MIYKPLARFRLSCSLFRLFSIPFYRDIHSVALLSTTSTCFYGNYWNRFELCEAPGITRHRYRTLVGMVNWPRPFRQTEPILNKVRLSVLSRQYLVFYSLFTDHCRADRRPLNTSLGPSFFVPEYKKLKKSGKNGHKIDFLAEFPRILPIYGLFFLTN